MSFDDNFDKLCYASNITYFGEMYASLNFTNKDDFNFSCLLSMAAAREAYQKCVYEMLKMGHKPSAASIYVAVLELSDKVLYDTLPLMCYHALLTQVRDAALLLLKNGKSVDFVKKLPWVSTASSRKSPMILEAVEGGIASFLNTV
jgi:hypothetical protein